eukprot:364789-Chlamydomonas_euryale.AAC.12
MPDRGDGPAIGGGPAVGKSDGAELAGGGLAGGPSGDGSFLTSPSRICAWYRARVSDGLLANSCRAAAGSLCAIVLTWVGIAGGQQRHVGPGGLQDAEPKHAARQTDADTGPGWPAVAV